MEVLFENKHGIKRVIAEVNNDEEGFLAINAFCQDHNFEIPYTRCWIEKSGALMVDVGSHTEFFHLVP